MSAEPKSLLQYRPMAPADLKRVIEIENQVYTHPWTLGNFRDSIQAQHRCVMLTYGDALIGYAVVMIAADEAHLLNLSVAAAWQRRGFGRDMLGFVLKLARNFAAGKTYLDRQRKPRPDRSERGIIFAPRPIA